MPLGRKAAVVSGDVHRYSFPRINFTVTLDGVTIKPALALGGWVAFKPMQRGHGNGRSRPARNRDQSRHDQADREWRRRSPPCIIICCALIRKRSICTSAAAATGQAGNRHPCGAGAEQDAAWGAGRRGHRRAIDLDTAQLDQIMGVKGRPTAASISSRVPRRDPIVDEWHDAFACRTLGVATGLAFSRPEAAMRRSPVIS